MVPRQNPRKTSLIQGLALRSQIVRCPLNSYSVTVSKCSGIGECADVCPVGVFGTDSAGRCTVYNEELCFGCMACMAQCADNGVSVQPRDARKYPSVEDIMR